MASILKILYRIITDLVLCRRGSTGLVLHPEGGHLALALHRDGAPLLGVKRLGKQLLCGAAQRNEVEHSFQFCCYSVVVEVVAVVVVFRSLLLLLLLLSIILLPLLLFIYYYYYYYYSGTRMDHGGFW